MNIKKRTRFQNVCAYPLPPNGCPDIFPQRKAKRHIIQGETYYYYTVSDGQKDVYTNSDGKQSYGAQGILSPDECTYINLYVNGVIQPNVLFEVRKGLLRLHDIPEKGVPIILQFVVLYT